ncbi:MAG: S26 family signal peptidase [Sulfurimonas sp.]|nr:S26 family signal peptidase [Sulfurimonas sp.]
MLKIFKIKGNSLYPLYLDGQLVVCIKVYKFYKLKTNNVIVFSKEGYGQMIKRIEKIVDDKYFVQGTGIDSIDSRDFGLVALEDISYKVIYKVKIFK